ncbi:TonB-dependent receptor [Hoylesella timonensis]|uniref:TonB-dependent receptor n=1 Tax=Hoylesella timonensis TaxID=386414 RepID=UPI003C6DAE10
MKTLLNKKTAATLALCLSMSMSTFGQNQVIHLTQNKATVSSIIKAIEKQTKMSVDFSQNTINLNKTVNLKSKSLSLGEIMNQILSGNGALSYKIVDRHIIIVKGEQRCVQSTQTTQQGSGKHKIAGCVFDNNGEPIIGASVVEQGTKNGTVTDIDGNFVLNCSKENATLSVSYIGFVPQQIKISGGATTNVTLKENAQSLEELVVVGYGSQKKVNVIGSIATVDSKSLETRSASDVSNMLTGQMSGVTITQTSGNPGQDGGTIRVRGVGSFGATPSPLVLVDGMPGSLSDITPDEIENISVLKDASSAAIYGSRAANGVVLVTTKRGKEGRTKVSYNGSVGFSKAAELPEMAHSYDYAKFYNIAAGTETYKPEEIQKYKDGSDPDNYADESYLDKLFGGHSFLTKHTLNVNGGNDRIQYMATAGYLHHDGLLENNYYNKYNARLNLNAEITKDLSMGIRLNGMASDRHEPSTPGALDTGGYAGIMLAALRYPGLLPSYMSDGSNGVGLKGSGTPVAWAEKCASFYRQDFDKFGGNIDLTYKPIKGLTIKGIGGYKYSLQHIRHYRSEFATVDGRANGPSSLSDDMYRTVYKTFQATADYNTTIAKKHAIDVLVGYTWEDENQRSVGGYRQKFPSNDVPYLTAGGADGQTNLGGGYDWAIQSIFGRLTYNYDERYLFEATMRYDGSSRFPTDSKYGFFPSAALGWRVSEEKFWKDSSVAKWFANLKIKASTGVLGNNNIGNYPYQSVYTLDSNQNYVFGGVYTTGASITTYVDPSLKWEKTHTSDIGIETGFFQNRLTLNATYFYRKTTDVLYKPSASYSSIFGLSVSQVNTGAVENKGWEFEVGYRDKVGAFNYWVNGNFSIIKNKVLTLGMGNVIQANGMVGNGSNLFIGYPMQMYYGYKTDGVFLTDEEVGEWCDQSAIAKGSKAGDIRYVDLDGDNKVTPKDMTYLGSSIPKYNFGLSFGGDYKGFDFSVLLQGVAGVKGRLNEWAGFAFFQEGNIQKWQMEECWNMNQTNRYPKYPRLEIMSNAGSNNTLLSDFWILNASFVKVRNIQFGYKLPKNIISRVGISSMRAYISLDNPFSFDSYRKGWDPENTNNRGSYYPVMSSYTFGLTLAF